MGFFYLYYLYNVKEGSLNTNDMVFNQLIFTYASNLLKNKRSSIKVNMFIENKKIT